MRRSLHSLALPAVAAIALTLAGPGLAGTHPNDRANPRPPAVDQESNPVRPDDRAWRGAGPEPTIVEIASPTIVTDGFDWLDATVGAAAAIGAALLMTGGAIVVRRRPAATA